MKIYPSADAGMFADGTDLLKNGEGVESCKSENVYWLQGVRVFWDPIYVKG